MTQKKAPSSTQLTLAPVHRDDPVESLLAAEKVDAAGQLRAVLVALYEARQPLSDDDLAARLGLLRHAAGTRRGVALKRGWVEKAGRGLTPRGNPCGLWALTAEGRRYVEAMNRSEAA